jgi:uncharacterized alkaline shock family protein YloU
VAELTKAPPAGEPAGLADAAERGSLDVRVKALQHLAERAALTTPGVVATRGSLGALGSLVGGGLPKATVATDSLGATVRVEVAVVWPCEVARIGQEARDRVLAEMPRLAGLDVRTVDVTVSLVDAADADQSHRRRVE